jgi:putative FmdB family regulatory protein
MPIYTYRCESCGVQFERHQSFTDEPLKRCPECNKNSLRKVLTPAGIVFKGSGWYATDHKSPSGLNRPLKTEGKESSTTSASASEGSGSSSSSGESSSSGSKSEGPSTKSESSGSSSKNESSSSKSESSSKSGE